MAEKHPQRGHAIAALRTYTVAVSLPTYGIRRAIHAPPPTSDWDSPKWSVADTATIGHYHPKSSSHRPRAEAKLLYDDQFLYVHFRVADRYVICIETADQGQVYRDSCVELFIRAGEDHSRGYLNFEMNCGGKLLLYHIEQTGLTPAEPLRKFIPVSSEWLERIHRSHTLPDLVEHEIDQPIDWRVSYAVPMELFEHHLGALPPPEARRWRGNFYKCADRSSHPHWGMWSPVECLNFHQPECFGNFRFDT